MNYTLATLLRFLYNSATGSRCFYNIVMAFKSKLDQDVINKVKELVAQGQPEQTIYALVGVSAQCWNRWKNQGQSDYESQIESIHRDLWAALQYGKSVFINNNLRVIQKAAERDWKAAAWLLERRIPEHFALKQEVNASVEGVTIKNDLPQVEWQNSALKTS